MGRRKGEKKQLTQAEKKEMGKRIKIARIRADMTQEMLADAVGIVPVYVSRIESGLGNPSLEIILNIANALYVSVDELLYDEPDRKEPQLPGGYLDLLKDCDEYETRILSYVLKMSKKTLRDSSDFRKMIEEMESKKIKGKQRKIQKKPLP